MARIRSIHPGLFTDEVFVSLSADAQVFLLGLWTEADDHGVFEWKPMTLRMRLRPTKDGPAEPLLAEIAATQAIKQFEIGGRQYGAIRNFRKYQRPKKPNAIHPITDEIRTYVALTAVSSELSEVEEAKVLPEARPSTEIAPQMEDGGGRREEISTVEAKASTGGSPAGVVVDFPGKPASDKPDWWPRRDRYGRVLGETTDKVLYQVGKAVLGSSAGGQITKLRKLHPYRFDLRAAIELLLRADDTAEPPAWFAKALKNAELDEPLDPKHVVFPENIYGER